MAKTVSKTKKKQSDAKRIAKRVKTVRKTQKKTKETVIEELRTHGTITRAAQKAGVDRTTVYRWMRDEIKFEKDVKEAVKIGNEVVNDAAKIALMQLIKSGDFRAIKYWLSHRSQEFGSRSNINILLATPDDILDAKKMRDIGQAIDAWKKQFEENTEE